MLKKVFSFLDEDDNYGRRRSEGDVEEQQLDEDDGNHRHVANAFDVDEDDFGDEKAHAPGPQNSFLSMIKEKRKINAEKKEDYEREIEQFNISASERRVEITLELEEEFEAFFAQASAIVKKKRAMNETLLLQKAGLEEPDTFKGTFSFKDVKTGKETMDLVSNIFRPRRQIAGRQFREDGDDIDACCQMLTGAREPPVNYDPLSDWEFNHWQRHYIGLRKLFNHHMDGEDLILNLDNVWLGNVISMKLVAEFIWRNTDMITGISAFKTKGFDNKNCLMVMQALKECRGLTVLNFDDTKLCKEGSAGLALIAKLSTSLEAVTLVNSQTMDAGACFWGLALASGCPNLQTLDLSNAQITSSGAIAIAIGLSKHQSLKVLNLSNNRVSREGCQRLGEALLVNPVLEELILSGNSIGSRGAMSLAAFLIHPNCELQTLDLFNNDIGRRGGRALAVALSINKSLNKLNLRCNDLGDVGIAGFGIALEKNSSLLELDLSDCDATDLGACALAIGLATNTSLNSLWLAAQVIADAGCSEIARHLASNKNSKLTHLDLSSNAIRDKGAKALAEMLRSNRSIVDMALNDNEIGNEGGIALGQVLSEKANSTLKVLNVSENPIAAEVCVEWFSKAERRLISQHTQRLDVVAQGTQMARGNLRGCGVIVMRSEMQGLYALVMGAIALLGGWFDFISDIIVANNMVREAIAEPAGHVIYASLIVFFVAFPFFYILIVFSLPADETDVTETVHGPSVHHLAPQGSSLMLGKMTTHTTSTSKSFKQHLADVTTTKCDDKRVGLFFINLFQMRMAYEIYLSAKNGLTTLAYSSIRLAETLFEAVPQSLIQMHILMSTANLEKLQRIGGVFNNEDSSILILFISVGFSVSIISNTLAGLFEEKFVVNWKRVAMAREDFAYWLGFFASYFYHATHYLMRALTVTLIASIYHPILAASFYALGLLMRLAIQKATKSERRKLFAMVSYLVGVASWDKRVASRIGVLLETLETFIVIGPLWVGRDVVLLHLATTQYVFQSNWLSLVDIVGPVFFTAFIYACWGLSFLLYVGFIERIHPYSDVAQVVDVSQAEALAKQPFSGLGPDAQSSRVERFKSKLMGSMGSSMRTGKLSRLFRFGGRRRSIGKKDQIEPTDEDEPEDKI